MLRLTVLLVLATGVSLSAGTGLCVAQTGQVQPPITTDEDTVPSYGVTEGELKPAETVELTDELAKKAIDAFVLVRDKYADSAIYQYETLEEFVQQTADGKKFEVDIKSFGFPTVGEWNIAISTVGLTYTAVSDGPDYDIASQIEEIKTDTTIAKEMKDRMVASLSSLIPSENNKKVIDELMKDAGYKEKLKLLAEEE